MGSPYVLNAMLLLRLRISNEKIPTSPNFHKRLCEKFQKYYGGRSSIENRPREEMAPLDPLERMMAGSPNAAQQNRYERESGSFSNL
jgi:hypothetical protein